eukprot:275296-Rhodomonas_salina.2
MSTGRIDPILLPYLWPRQVSFHPFSAIPQALTSALPLPGGELGVLGQGDGHNGEKGLPTGGAAPQRLGPGSGARAVSGLPCSFSLPECAIRYPFGRVTSCPAVVSRFFYAIFYADINATTRQRKYAGLPQCFFQLVALRVSPSTPTPRYPALTLTVRYQVLDTEDDVDFNGFAAAVYRSGQMLTHVCELDEDHGADMTFADQE